MKTRKVNLFNNPKFWRNAILNSNCRIDNTRKLEGKAFTCVFFTKYCDVGCPFCFFRSDLEKPIPAIKGEFSEEGFEKFVSFANSANLGYLLISGGGEPFTRFDYIVETIRRVNVGRIVIVTSGNWALEYEKAKKLMETLFETNNARIKPAEIVVRLSLDEFHCKKLGYTHAINIIRIFEKYYSTARNFSLKIHTMLNDKAVDNLMGYFPKSTSTDKIECSSDSTDVVKVEPYSYKVCFESGYQVQIGVAKIFYPNLKADLKNSNGVIRAIDVFDEDMKKSEDYNPSVLRNYDGTEGLDFWINYNGNVTTWGNQLLDNLHNIYVDDYSQIVERTLSDPASLGTIDKGFRYREDIISEVNPLAVLRSKVINIRDYAGAIMLEESHTRLYYTLRVLQDYRKEGKLNDVEFFKLPSEIRECLCMTKEELISLYNESNYSIFSEYVSKRFVAEEWQDLFELVQKGHYQVNDSQIQDAIRFYNENSSDKVESIDSMHIRHDPNQYARLIEKIIHIKVEALERR